MASVLFVLPIGIDMGGIITSSREVVAGIQAAGHTCDFATVHFTTFDHKYGPLARGKYAGAFVWDDVTEAMYHPMLGWREEPRFNLATEEGVVRFLASAKGYDIIIWGCVFPFADQDAAIWLRAFGGHKAKQLVMIHDDHLTTRYPWALGLSRYVDGYVGMFKAAYDSLADVASDRSLTYNPIAPLSKAVTRYDRRRGFLSCQVWKPWKNADKLVAAAAFMGDIDFAGDGIQLRYMRSPDKCPPKLKGMWNKAVGMRLGNRYLGVIDETARTKMLKEHRFLVDLSYRPNNSGQINTIVQQAMAEGCVVIANPNFLGDDPFTPMKDYVPITEDQYGPEDLARKLQLIDKEIRGDRYTAIQDNARRKLRLFDRTSTGQKMVDFAFAAVSQRAPKEHVKFFKDQFGVTP